MLQFKSAYQVSKFCFIAIVLLSPVFLQASETKLKKGVKGIWFGPNEWDIPAHKLNASWIWADESLDAKTILARRTITTWKEVESV